MDTETVDRCILEAKAKEYAGLILSVIYGAYVPSETMNTATKEMIRYIFPASSFKVFMGDAIVLDDGTFDIDTPVGKKHLSTLDSFVVRYLLPCSIGDYPIVERLKGLVA